MATDSVPHKKLRQIYMMVLKRAYPVQMLPREVGSGEGPRGCFLAAFPMQCKEAGSNPGLPGHMMVLNYKKKLGCCLGYLK
jgi:hypothetical protein